MTVMLFALVSGVFWGTWFALSRSIAIISPQTFLDIGKITISNLALPMSILMPLTLVCSITVSYLLFQKKWNTPFYLTLSGVLLMISALLITLLVNVPIDNQIKEWTTQALPANWEELRDRWEFYHTLRTFISLASLALVLAAALWKQEKVEEIEVERGKNLV